MEILKLKINNSIQSRIEIKDVKELSIILKLKNHNTQSVKLSFKEF